jgi:hypothetical protein
VSLEGVGVGAKTVSFEGVGVGAKTVSFEGVGVLLHQVLGYYLSYLLSMVGFFQSLFRLYLCTLLALSKALNCFTSLMMMHTSVACTPMCARSLARGDVVSVGVVPLLMTGTYGWRLYLVEFQRGFRSGGLLTCVCSEVVCNWCYVC